MVWVGSGDEDTGADWGAEIGLDKGEGVGGGMTTVPAGLDDKTEEEDMG